MMPGVQPTPREVKIKVHDGVEIAVALYMPEGEGPFPVLLAPSPYRYDNNTLPAGPQFLWRETGPIDFYLKHGYVYANMDVRGGGKSGGEFRLLDRGEQSTSTTSSKRRPPKAKFGGSHALGRASFFTVRFGHIG